MNQTNKAAYTAIRGLCHTPLIYLIMQIDYDIFYCGKKMCLLLNLMT